MRKASRMLAVTSAVITVGVVGAAGAVMAAPNNAVVTRDGHSKTLYMLPKVDTNSILRRAGIAPQSGDVVLRSTNVQGKIVVNVRTAYPVAVHVDGRTREAVAHFGDTVGEVLRGAGIRLGPVDTVNVPLTSAAKTGVTVRVTRNEIVTVSADGTQTQVVVPVGTQPQQTVRAAGVRLGSSDAVAAQNGVLAVQRVTYKDFTTTEQIPYDTTTKDDSTLPQGQTQEQTAGENGQKQIVSRTKYVNGKPTETQVVSSTVVRQPVTRVVLNGTQVPQTPSSEADSSAAGSSAASAGSSANGLSYSQVLSGECTAYTGGGTCANGMAAAVGRVAVNPAVIPYGTRLYIASADGSYVYGYAIAADTGGFVSSSSTMVDLYMNSESECAAFGRRVMNIYVLN